MKEQIYTIPINESFEKKCGCPLCRLLKNAERDAIENLLGASMMEPQIRLETNKKGFCQRHLEGLFDAQKRLPLSLILESHLIELIEKAFSKPNGDYKKTAEAVNGFFESCYICDRLNLLMEHYCKNIAYMYKEPSFKTLFEAQEYFCLKHLSLMLGYARKVLSGGELKSFTGSAVKVSGGYALSLKDNVTTFNKSFDYRFTGSLSEREAGAVSLAKSFLTGDGE